MYLLELGASHKISEFKDMKYPLPFTAKDVQLQLSNKATKKKMSGRIHNE